MTIPVRRHGGAALVLLGVLLLAQSAAAKDTPALVRKVEDLLVDVRAALAVHESRVERVTAQHGVGGDRTASRLYRLQSRINDGLVFYQLGEHERASILLMDVVQDPRNKDYEGYKDALFYLAEALYQLDNPIGASGFYLMVLDRGFRQYEKDSLLRLIEISSKLHQHEHLDRFMKRLNAMPDALSDSMVRYVYAKSLFVRSKRAEARAQFERVDSTSPYYLRARYFLGTLAVLDGDLEQAAARFSEVAGAKGETPENVNTVELAHLAMGRLRLEQEQYDQAIDEYQHIPRDSVNFDLALHEVAWTFIKHGDHEQALRSIDILLLAAPESPLAPEAMLLRANLHLRLGQHDDAEAAFREVVERFGPVRTELESLIREHSDPEAYFHELIGRDPKHFDVEVRLPPLAAKWVEADDQVASALRPARELQVAKADVTQAATLIARLEDALAADNRIEIFPELAEAWASMLETETALIVVKQRLVDAERQVIGEAASSSEQREFTQLHDHRAGLEKRFMALPHTAQGVAQREARIQREMEALQMQAFRLGLVLDSLRAQLVAMKKWIADTSQSSVERPPGAGERRVREAVAAQEAEIAGLESELVGLRRTIERAQTGVGIGDPVTAEEARLKQRYDETIGKEARLLQGLRPRLSADGRRLLAALDTERARIRGMEERIRKFFLHVQRTVDDKVRSFQQQLETEKKLMTRYERQAEGFRSMSEGLAGRIAHQSLRKVRDQFRGLVLQADVGIIDVAWALKERQTAEYQAKVRERKAELQTLEQEFNPVLEAKP